MKPISRYLSATYGMHGSGWFDEVLGVHLVARRFVPNRLGDSLDQPFPIPTSLFWSDYRQQVGFPHGKQAGFELAVSGQPQAITGTAKWFTDTRDNSHQTGFDLEESRGG